MTTRPNDPADNKPDAEQPKVGETGPELVEVADDGSIVVPTVSVRVPQSDGDIVVAFDGDEPITLTVANHLVDIPESKAARFLAAIDGSEIAGGNPAPTKE